MKRARNIKSVLPLFVITAALFACNGTSAYADGARGERGVSAPRGGAELVAARGGGRDMGTRSGGREVVTRSGGRGGYVGRGVYSGGGYRGGRSHFSGSIWIGPGWGFWDPFYYPYYPYYYPYPGYRYYPAPSVVVPQENEEYVAPEPESQQEETGYWYFCRKPEGYYPYVERCPSGWMKVVPNTTPPREEQEDKEN